MKSFFHLPLYIYHSHGWITNTYCAKVCPFILALYLCFSVKIVIFISSFFSNIVHLCLSCYCLSLSLSGSIYRNISIYLYICLYLCTYLSIFTLSPPMYSVCTVRIPGMYSCTRLAAAEFLLKITKTCLFV